MKLIIQALYQNKIKLILKLFSLMQKTEMSLQKYYENNV